MSPVDLGLFAWQRAQTQIGFPCRSRAQPSDDGTEVIGGARITTLAHHLVEAARAQGGELRQRLDDKGQVGLNHGGPYRLLRHRHPGRCEYTADGRVMHAQLGGDSADRPVLGVIEAQDLSFEGARDHRRSLRSASQGAETREGRQRALAETAARWRSRRVMRVGPSEGKCGDLDSLGCTGRTRSLFPVSCLGIGHLCHALGGEGRHYDSGGGSGGTLMRHFLCSTRTPGALASRVPTGAAVALLVASPGAVQRLASADRGAGPRAVGVAAVASAADPHLLTAAPAVVEPRSVFEHRPAQSSWDWTTPCIAGIKGTRPCPYRGTATLKVRGSRSRMYPGLRFFGVADQDSGVCGAEVRLVAG